MTSEFFQRPIRPRLNVELPDWSSSFFCLAFFCLVGLSARNDGGTGPPAIAYYIVLRSVQRLYKSKRGRRRINLMRGSCMELIINDMPQYGVLIHGQESPGFKEKLLSVFRDSPFRDPPNLNDDELPCSFIVENQTLSHIVRITFICSPYPRESGPSFSLSDGDSRI